MAKANNESIKQYVENFGYTLLNSVEGSKEMMNLICPKGHEWDVNFGDFKFGKRCPHCKNEAKKEEQLQKIKEIMASEGYELLEEKYINNSTPMKTRCPLGHEFYVSPNNFKKGRRCSECYKFKKLTYEYVCFFFYEEGYEVLSNQYTLANDKIKVKCPHGHIFEISYAKFYSGRRCSQCKKSSGEQEVENILRKYNLEYKYQFIFKDCKRIMPLPFDFYLPQYNTLIEFDGEQHFKNNRFKNTNLEDIQERDMIKTKYCEDNNIKLIRIPFWDFDKIEKIICQELNLNK